MAQAHSTSTRVRQPRLGFQAVDAAQAMLTWRARRLRRQTPPGLVDAADEDRTATAPVDTWAAS